jgi:predicted nucleic acid-binding protein
MRDRLVCDASAVVSALLDSGVAGTWAAARLAGADLFAPALMPFECSNIIRRHELGALVSADQAVQAHTDLVELPVDLWPYEALATRIWQLRPNLTTYDAAYVALAEALELPLVTLDQRVQRAPGINCAVETPSAPARRVPDA